MSRAASIDFTKPQQSLTVNGFPLSFREVELNDGTTVWVPRGISRNHPARCWRIYAVSEQGVLADNVHDAEHSGSSLASLDLAYLILIESHKGSTSRFSVDRRQRAPGKERDPMVDSGYTGVMIGRTSRRGVKAVTVVSKCTLKSPDGSLKFSNWYAGSVSERDANTDPNHQQQKLTSLLHNAIAVRRYFNRLRSQGQYPTEPIKLEDVPKEIIKKPVKLPSSLDITEILDSYVVAEWKPVNRTTNGDPEALTASLQSHDPTKPHKNIWLCGFVIRFKETEVEGGTFYLPKNLFRARGEWRLRIIHKNGVFNDSVSDEECGGSSLKSLHEAWCYLFSEFRQHEAPEPNTKWYAKNPLLDTGISRVNINPMRRMGKKAQKKKWSFSLGMSIPAEGGRSERIPLSSWRLSTVTDEQIQHDLKYASAISSYREHLIARGKEAEAETLGKGSDVPKRFWPKTPPCPITVDDLWYHAEQVDGPRIA